MSGIPAVGARVEVHYRRSVDNDSRVEETLVPAAPAVGVLCVPPPLRTNPYQHLLYDSVAPYGLRLVSGVLKTKWLLLNRRKARVVHLHWPETCYRHRGRASTPLSWVKLGLFGSRLAVARVLRYRVVWTLHQLAPHDPSARGLDRAAARMIARLVHAIIAHDKTTAGMARGALPAAAKKLTVIPHGSYVGVYPPGRPRAEVRRSLGLDEQTCVFLSFGHLRGYKDLDVLFEAFAQVARPDVALVVAGLAHDPALRARLDEAAARDPRVILLARFVPDEEVAELFGAADAAVFPRHDGGTSGSLLLALSLGVPAVAADAGAGTEVLRDGGGWLFPPGDVAALSQLLTELAEDREALSRQSEEAWHVALGRDWSRLGRRLAAVLIGHDRADVLLVCSSGGHLLQLLALREAWEPFSRVWVSNDRSDARSQLAEEDALFLPGPASRSLRALVHNARAALSLVRSRRPRVVITTGADIAVPFAWIGRLYGARVVYVESFTRISRPSLTCRLIRPVASRVYAQWPELLDSLPNARYVGAVVESEPVVAP